MPRRLTLVLALCAAIGGCRLTTDATAGLEVSLSAGGAQASATNPVDLTITIVNRRDQDVQTPDPRSYACFPPYRVSDSAGNPVVLPGRLCAAIGYSEVVLAPGDSLVLSARWSGDKASAVENFGAVPVSPGHYSIRARVRVDEHELSSAPVAVTVP